MSSRYESGVKKASRLLRFAQMSRITTAC